MAAWSPELRPLVRALRREPAERRVVCRTVGVGLIESGIGTTRAIMDLRPSRIVLVGTAGAYQAPRAPALGTVAVASAISLASGTVARGDAYLPRALPTRLVAASALRRQLVRSAAAKEVDVACPLAVTRSRAAAERIRLSTRAQVENLEALAVARAAAGAGVPFAAVLGVSNLVGPRAHAEWRKHAAPAAAAACRAVHAWLRRLSRPRGDPAG